MKALLLKDYYTLEKSHTRSSQHCPRRTAEAGGEQGEDILEHKHGGSANGSAEPAQHVPAQDNVFFPVGQHPGKGVPAALLVIGHGGIGDHGAVNHGEYIEKRHRNHAP